MLYLLFVTVNIKRKNNFRMQSEWRKKLKLNTQCAS